MRSFPIHGSLLAVDGTTVALVSLVGDVLPDCADGQRLQCLGGELICITP